MLMLVCGEPSGDQLGAQLMAGLKALDPTLRIVGVGGAAMARMWRRIERTAPTSSSTVGLRSAVADR